MKRVFIAGHKGMVGSAIARNLAKREGIDIVVAERTDVDLTDQGSVRRFLGQGEIDEIYLAAAKVGGIHANNAYPAEFIYENLMIECNIIHGAHLANIDKLLFLGSSCIYPKLAEQPIAEESLLTGKLEPTNEPYAIAKIAGIKLCESYNRQYGRSYRSVMPTNLYGQNDNFHPENSHVIPALMRRIHEAKLAGDEQVHVWGSGKAMREFLHVDDMAAACVHVMDLPKHIYESNTHDMLSHLNVGTGEDCTIHQLTQVLVDVIGYRGTIIFDTSKPDGTPRKLMSPLQLMALGWKYEIPLRQGLEATYAWFLQNQSSYRA